MRSYVACDLDDEAMDSLCSYFIDNESITRTINEKIDGVEAIKRVKNGREYTILLNHTNEAKTVESITLSPFDVKIIETKN